MEEATGFTRQGVNKCSVNFVLWFPYFFASLSCTRAGMCMWGNLSEDLGNPTFQMTDFKHEVFERWVNHSIKPKLPKIIILSFIPKWVANYGLKKLKMEVSRYLGPNCTHQKSVQTSASAKYCSVFPSIEINVSQDWFCFFTPSSFLFSDTDGWVC